MPLTVAHSPSQSLQADQFNSFFTSVGANATITSKQLAEDYDLNITRARPTPRTFPDEDQFHFKPVSCNEVEKVIKSMPSNKAPGYDKIPIRIYKDCLPHILKTVTSLLNTSFESCTFPRAWKKAEVVPHHKDGDHEVANNNRPISLLPALSKVAERIALCQFTSYLNENHRLTSHQSGNRKFHSTETLNLLVSDHIFKAVDGKKITAMVLIDLSKAFDSLSHAILLEKLQDVGTSSSALSWFGSYLSDRYQSTRLLFGMNFLYIRVKCFSRSSYFIARS